MALSQHMVSEVAARLHEAERTREQIAQISLAHSDITIDDAYAIQREWGCLKIGGGRKPIGFKIGLTSRAMQRSFNISEPNYGMLLDDMSFAAGVDIPFERFIVPRIEVELAFVLKKNLRGPNCTIFDVLGATEYVMPALEIIDARIQHATPDTNATRNVVDIISDNAGTGGIVLGGSPVRPHDIDLRRVSAILYRNAAIEESGVAAAVLNHPANGLAWLANKLHLQGVELDAGQVILGGSFTTPIPVRSGDIFHADYGPLGSIACHFAGTRQQTNHDGK
jgi:2-oxo-hept-3-ene-1,7-dioate hydratase